MSVYWRIESDNIPYIVEYCKKELSKNPNFKWNSQHGKALDDILRTIDKNFNESMLRAVGRLLDDCEEKKSDIVQREKELAKRERDILSKESTISYPFSDSKFRDVYIMAEALRHLMQDKYGKLSENAESRIIDMVTQILISNNSAEDVLRDLFKPVTGDTKDDGAE